MSGRETLVPEGTLTLPYGVNARGLLYGPNIARDAVRAFSV
jgi:hypothetical protein